MEAYDWLFGEGESIAPSTEEETPQEQTEVEDYGPVWTTKSGDKIPVRKMATSHIINSMRMIQDRKDGFSKKWLTIFGDELCRRKQSTFEPGFSL